MDIINLDEIKQALARSGYLLESRLIKTLVENGYYFNPSVRYSDSTTGVDREIDIVAHSKIVNGTFGSVKLSINHDLIIECTNNPQPIVFFKLDQSNNHIDTHNPYISWSPEHVNEAMKHLWSKSTVELTRPDLYYLKEAHPVQYCSFTQKRSPKEWMALHPDEVHSMMGKFKDYLETLLESYSDVLDDSKGEKFRHILIRVVWVTTSDLYLAHEENGEISLTPQNYICYLHKFSDQSEIRDIVVDVVSEKGFVEYLKMNQAIDKQLCQALDKKY